MLKPEANRSRRRTPVLVIDSSSIRNHLFKGWAVLNRVAVIARTGTINLCVPWVVEQEVLTGIESHVEKLTGQEAFVTSVRALSQMSTEGAAIRNLCDRFEALRPKLCEEARSRFRHWLETAQAERLPLQHEHTEKVFKAYFAGTPPFDRPKNREHFPDAFIYNSVLDLNSQEKEVWFLAGDGQLRESLRKVQGIRVYRDFYPLFADLQVPFDYEAERALSTFLPEFRFIEEAVHRSLRGSLAGQPLRWSGAVCDGQSTVKEVLHIRSLSLDRQSVMHMDDSAFLIAFEADLDALGAERSVVERDIVERLSMFAISIRGHLLVRIEKGTEDEQHRVASVELDDFALGTVQKSTATEVVRAIAPAPRVVEYHRQELDDIVKNKRGGLVVVVGSTLRNRRIVAEHICAARLNRNEIALLSFPSVHEKQLLSYDCGDKTERLWEKVEDTQPQVLGLSNEDPNWAMEAIKYLSESDCFIVATMKSASNRSAVVRFLSSLPNRENNLESLLAVAWIQEVTPEIVTFGISQHSGWGDGSWHEVLRRDEWLRRSRV